MGRVRVFVGCSLDGFIAGPDDDLSWLEPPEGVEEVGDHGFGALLAETGALLMGRRTFDVVAGFEGPWPYGERPVLVATRRPLPETGQPVQAVSGSIADLIARAREAAGSKDVYLDGGDLIRQALDAVLVDRITVTVVPMVIGAGVPLFAGCARRHALELVRSEALGRGLVQLDYAPRPAADG